MRVALPLTSPSRLRVSLRTPALIRRYAPVWPALNWFLFGLGLAFILGAMSGVIPYGDGVMGDGSAFYYVQTPYDWTDRQIGVPEYRYSPAFLWLTEPLRWVPFELFVAIWTALHVAAIAWLAPWMLAFPGVADDIISGNINTFLALVIVLTVRGQEWTWAGVLLTKVTPGLGILYHVGRRDWRAVWMALGVTSAIVLLGALIAPEFWAAWLGSLMVGPETYQTIDVLAPLPVRLAVGAALCLASSRWPWLLPLGVIIAIPGLWPSSFALLAAIPRLLALADRRAMTSRPFVPIPIEAAPALTAMEVGNRTLADSHPGRR